MTWPLKYDCRNNTALMTTVSCEENDWDVDSPMSLGFDLRPFLYPSRFPWQFKKIDEVAAVLPDRSTTSPAIAKAKLEGHKQE